MCGQTCGKICLMQQKRSKAEMGNRETNAGQCQTIERNILYWTKRWRIQAHNESRLENVGSSDASSNAVRNTDNEQWRNPPQFWKVWYKRRLCCSNVTDLLSDGKTPYERRFGEPFQRLIILFGSLVECHPITAKDQSRIHQFGQKVLPGSFFGYALHTVWIWKGDILVADIEELETMDASEIHSKKASMRKRWYFQRKRRIYFLIEDGTVKTPWRRSRLENIHLDTAATNSSRKSLWFCWRTGRVSSTTSRRVSGCRQSNQWLLVHVRKFQLPPSRWTQSQTLLAERRIISNSTQVHRRY